VVRGGEKPPGLPRLRAFLADKLASYERPGRNGGAGKPAENRYWKAVKGSIACQGQRQAGLRPILAGFGAARRPYRQPISRKMSNMDSRWTHCRSGAPRRNPRTPLSLIQLTNTISGSSTGVSSSRSRFGTLVAKCSSVRKAFNRARHFLDGLYLRHSHPPLVPAPRAASLARRHRLSHRLRKIGVYALCALITRVRTLAQQMMSSPSVSPLVCAHAPREAQLLRPPNVPRADANSVDDAAISPRSNRPVCQSYATAHEKQHEPA